jgi:uncharacterized membrane protein
MINQIVPYIYPGIVSVMSVFLFVFATIVFVTQLIDVNHTPKNKNVRTVVCIICWYVALLLIASVAVLYSVFVASRHGLWSYFEAPMMYIICGYLMWRLCDYAESYVTHLDYHQMMGQKPLISRR